MSVKVFLEGQRAEIEATFEDANNVLTNPTAVKFFVKAPSGIVTEFDWPAGQITNPSVGVFLLQYDVDVPGEYKVYAQGTGTVKASSEGMFDCIASHVV